ncbi:hypothetical protein ONA70_20190 [Micromonospora yasonensis]|uniref:hypothetical protein n=1 Tax=Micromonospora yasonensis TaxID=1128667 RepID=UPI00222FA786|nr:hypothetical protein [Micromonospora yasonensis]MCW3842424.1 hypothetical protein [Micromonospora yasonensis]
MARRGWGGSVATALGVAAGTGAAQLGFGYGLGIINWSSAGGTRVEAAWVASLAWATWISATSVVAGAVCAHRLRGADEEPGRTLRNLTLAVAAGVGALITVLLVAVPARGARVPETLSPQAVAAGYAAVGLLAGLLLAVWALHSRAAAGNLVATTGWLWLLAVVSVVDGVLAGRGLTTAQLGIWQISADSERLWIRDYFYWPGALLALGSALLIGVLAARRTARLPERRLGAAASGAAGPILVALAYLLAVPRLAAIAPEQLSAHLIAPYAVIAGFGGSVLAAVLAQRAELRAARAAVALPRQRTDEPAGLPGPEPDPPSAGSAAEGTEATSPGVAPAGPDPEAATSTDRARSARATGGRGRAVPSQRKPSDQPALESGSQDASDVAPTEEVRASNAETTAPTTGPKPRRRGR